MVFGGGGVWCSLCQLCTATGLSVEVLKIRLHKAEQGVLFAGEAVGGTRQEGVVGWGCSRCRSQRLKLAKFLSGNRFAIISITSRSLPFKIGGEIECTPLRPWPKFREESIKIEGVKAIFRLVNFWCGLARWPNKGGKNPV